MKRTVRLAALAALVLVLAGWLGQAEAQSITNDQRSNTLTAEAYQAIAKGDCSTAEQKLDQALRLNPDNLYAMLNMGVVYNNTGRADKAKEMFRKVAAINTKEKPAQAHFAEDQGLTIPQLAQRNLDNLEKSGGRVSGACPILPKSRPQAQGSGGVR